MNRFEIRDILKAHREHFRVLPTLAQNELNGIIQAIDAEVVKEAKPVAKKKPIKIEAPAVSLTVGKVAKKKVSKKKGK